MKVPDPCGAHFGFEKLVAMFIKKVIIDTNCRSATARAYGEAVNILFEKRSLGLPAKFDDKDNLCAIICNNLKVEEDIAKQRSAITQEMFALMKVRADEETDRNSFVVAMFDWTCLNKVIGCRLSEYGQKTQQRVEVHEYPSGKKVTKAFIKDDWTFYYKNGKKVVKHGTKNIGRIGKVSILWRIQKNRRNGQRIMVVAEEVLELSAAEAAYRIFLRAEELDIEKNQPIGVFVNEQKKTCYITGNKIAKYLQEIAREAHPEMTEEEIKRFSAHSFRVWALVLLSEAGAKPHFMQARLRWLGESFRLYLRDTAEINEQHAKALEKSSKAVMTLMKAHLNDELPDDVPEDEEMGQYNDIE